MIAIPRAVTCWKRRRLRIAMVAFSVVSLALGAVPAAAAAPATPELTSPESEQSMGDPEKSPYEQYGSIGCSVVPGFNDRCPSMVSQPHVPQLLGQYSEGLVDEGLVPDQETSLPGLIGSPDGTMVYALADQQSESTPGTSASVVIAYRADPSTGGTGEIVWSKEFGGSAVYPHSVGSSSYGGYVGAVSHDGRVLFVYRNLLDIYWNIVEASVLALDTATGRVLWEKHLSEEAGDGAMNYRTVAARLTVSPDSSRVFVSVWLTHMDLNIPGDTKQEAWFSALDASSGEPVWKTSYTTHKPNRPALDKENTLTLSPDGSRMFAQIELRDNRNSTIGMATVAYDTSSGELLWEQPYMFNGVPHGMVASPDGNHVFVLARPSRTELLLHSYDARTGNLEWARRYVGTYGTGCDDTQFQPSGAKQALALSVSGDLVYVVGTAGHAPLCYQQPDFSYGWGAAVVAVRAATGDVEWETYFGAEEGDEVCYIYTCDIAVAPGPGGGDEGSQVLISTRYSTNSGTQQMGYPLTLSFDGRDGSLLWQSRYLDTFNDGGTHFWSNGDMLLNDAGTFLYLVHVEISKTREWDSGALQVVGYDLRQESQ